MKIGILGGSFNPIHKGHLNLGQSAVKVLNLDKVIFIPANLSPFKDNKEMIPAEDRFKMCEIAISKYEKFEISDIEINKNEKNYTIDTIKELIMRYPEDELYLLVGSDEFLLIDKWKDYKEIFKLVKVCTLARTQSDIERINNKKKELERENLDSIILDSEIVDISATEIRKDIGKADNNLVIPEVIDYINRNDHAHS